MSHTESSIRTFLGILGLAIFLYAAGELVLRLLFALIGLALFFYGFAFRRRPSFIFMNRNWHNFRKDNF